MKKPEKEEDPKKLPNFNLIEIMYKGQIQKFDLSPIFSLTYKTKLEELSVEEIEENLEKTSAYRFSISSLKEAVIERAQELKDDYDSWTSSIWSNLVDTAILRRNLLRENHGTHSTKWIGSVTKEEIQRLLIELPEYATKYKQKISALRKYEKSIRELSKAYDIISDRSSLLQSILKRRTNKFSV